MEYLILTIKHKLYVLLAGWKIRAPLWRLITHDLSKFSVKEYPHYQKQFFGNGSYEFDEAWLHHQNTNDHHWEYWVPRTSHDRGTIKEDVPMPMSYGAAMEMVADWIGASRVYTNQWPSGKSWSWLDQRIDICHKKVHITTFVFVLFVLKKYDLMTEYIEEKYWSKVLCVTDVNKLLSKTNKGIYSYLRSQWSEAQQSSTNF